MAAVSEGNLEASRWAYAQDCTLHVRLCIMAVMYGHLEVLQLLRAQVPPAPWGVEVCQTAASKGRLDLLQWLRSQTPPCPWDDTTCLAAAEQGHLEMLRWLRVQAPPCQWDVRACLAVTPRSASEMCAWLSELLSDDTDSGSDYENEGYIDDEYSGDGSPYHYHYTYFDNNHDYNSPYENESTYM